LPTLRLNKKSTFVHYILLALKNKTHKINKNNFKVTMKSYKEYVREFYKVYYKDGDDAHLIDHADTVCDLALKINSNCDEKLIILASYMHDMFNATNRSLHDKLAYEYVLKRDDHFLKELSDKELLMVAHATLEHRAKFKGKFYSKLSEIISAADRGLPDLNIIVIRSMKFNNANAQDVYTHIKEKYSSSGYAKYPKIYKDIFKKELQQFKKDADTLSVKDIETIWQHRSC
jgi:hypothetical protein